MILVQDKCLVVILMPLSIILQSVLLVEETGVPGKITALSQVTI
jgi:hypothetical protein